MKTKFRKVNPDSMDWYFEWMISSEIARTVENG
jgi:hypothetical protein